MRVAEFISCVDELAPFALAEDWDNVGLLIGRGDAPATSVMVALDARLSVVAAAAEAGCDVILTHHPVIFPSLSAVTDASATGLVVQAALAAGISVVAAHTNLDAATGGLNDHLAQVIGMSDARPLVPHPSLPHAGLGRVGRLGSLGVADLAASVGEALGLPPLGFTGEPERPVRVVACCTGSGAGFIDRVRDAGADAYITGDLKYHDADRADTMALIQAPHAATEDWALRRWFPLLRAQLEPHGVDARLAPMRTDPWTPGHSTL